MRNGSVAVGCGVGGGSANLVIDVNNGNPSGNGPTRSWTLTQAVVASGQTITMWGDITIIDATTGTTTLVGGWTWSVASGPQIDPASNSGFQAAVAEMLNLTTASGGSVAAGGFDLGTILTWLANVTKLGINYIRDWFIQYTPPTSCIGPIVEDGAGQSCENAGLLCGNDLADMCLNIADMPGSTGFKKCMKGRCGCGGSSFPRLKIKCAATSDCGVCGLAGGCSLVGDDAWYCQSDGADACSVCVDTVFHEMSHACGALDDPDCMGAEPACPVLDPDSVQGACRIGLWFGEQCCLEPPAGN